MSAGVLVSRNPAALVSATFATTHHIGNRNVFECRYLSRRRVTDGLLPDVGNNLEAGRVMTPWRLRSAGQSSLGGFRLCGMAQRCRSKLRRPATNGFIPIITRAHARQASGRVNAAMSRLGAGLK